MFVVKRACFLGLFLTAFAFANAVFAGSFSNSPVISANPYASFSNGNAYLQQGIPLLFKYHSLTIGDQRQHFGFPQRNFGFCVPSATNNHLTDSVASMQFSIGGNLHAGAFSAISNNTQSSLRDNILPGGFVGASALGALDSLDFDVNAAFYIEHHNHKNPPSADRQKTGWVVWDNKNRETINYKRVQGHLGFNYAWLRLELGRDAMHWGPGFYNNLTLNRQAVPYEYASIDLVFGPLRVFSFFGSLEIESASSKNHTNDSRNLYGHRYELALGNATIGMSEIQVIYNNNNAWLLVPVYPLFMEKGNYTEHSNNGALAFDVNYRILQTARIYGEFYMDDFDSPITIFENEYLNSQWALMLGVQAANNYTVKSHKLEAGFIFEYSRVDQFVYAHFEPNEAQMANAGHPLGNQLGPNSQTIDWLLYAQIDNALLIGLRNTWLWKGNVYGSDLNSIWVGPGDCQKKDFLGGAKMQYALTPMFAYNTERWLCSGAISLFAEKKGEFSVSVKI